MFFNVSGPMSWSMAVSTFLCCIRSYLATSLEHLAISCLILPYFRHDTSFKPFANPPFQVSPQKFASCKWNATWLTWAPRKKERSLLQLASSTKSNGGVASKLDYPICGVSSLWSHHVAMHLLTALALAGILTYTKGCPVLRQVWF